MKIIQSGIYLGVLIAFISLNILHAQESTRQEQKTKDLVKNITWIDNACVKIAGSRTIYFDPYRISEKDSADLIFVTHDHDDHFSMSGINRIKTNNTIIVGPACVINSINTDKRTVKAGDVIQLKGIKIQVVPSYNINKSYHAKGKGHVGFIVTMDGVTYYHPGDTDFIPEMKKIKADVAFLPVGGTYTMNAEEAVEAAMAIKPKVVVPFHWGSVIGSRADAEKFQTLYSGKSVILKMN